MISTLEFEELMNAYYSTLTCQMGWNPETSEEIDETQHQEQWQERMVQLQSEIEKFQTIYEKVMTEDHAVLRSLTEEDGSPPQRLHHYAFERMRRRAFQRHSNITMADTELLDIEAARNYFLLNVTLPPLDTAQNRRELRQALDCFSTWYSNMVQGTCEELQECLEDALYEDESEGEIVVRPYDPNAVPKEEEEFDLDAFLSESQPLKDQVLILMQREHDGLLSALCSEAKQTFLNGLVDMDQIAAVLKHQSSPYVVYELLRGQKGYIQFPGHVGFGAIAAFKDELKAWALQQCPYLQKYISERCSERQAQELRLYRIIIRMRRRANTNRLEFCRWLQKCYRAKVRGSCGKLLDKIHSQLIQSKQSTRVTFCPEDLANIFDQFSDVTILYTLKHFEVLYLRSKKYRKQVKMFWDVESVEMFQDYCKNQMIVLHRRTNPTKAMAALSETKEKHMEIWQWIREQFQELM